MLIIHVAGARPNFVKVSSVMAALDHHSSLRQVLVHTGQHYDINMSEIFFNDLELPQPDINLEVGSGSHAAQTAEIMIRFEKIAYARCPDWIVVYGDVNSTLAAALVAAKLNIRVAHVEAGLRSFDRSMPEEINRLLTDQVADLLFTPSEDADRNLLREGVAPDKIHRVGNVMIDTMVRLLPRVDQKSVVARFGLVPRGYGLVTLHRPSNVDTPKMLGKILSALNEVSDDLPLIFPVHPRTRQRLAGIRLSICKTNLHLVEPLSYLDFLALQNNAVLVITDSGGIQEETTYLQVPCITLRNNTERPITVTMGTNILAGQDTEILKREAAAILNGSTKQGLIPPLWDGMSGERIAQVITKWSS